MGTREEEFYDGYVQVDFTVLKGLSVGSGRDVRDGKEGEPYPTRGNRTGEITF